MKMNLNRLYILACEDWTMFNILVVQYWVFMDTFLHQVFGGGI